MAPQGKCPTCGLRVGSKPGEQTPVHSALGKQGPCPGGTTKPL